MDTTRPQHLFLLQATCTSERTGEGGVLLSFSTTPEVHDSLMMLAENSLKGKGVKQKCRVCSTLTNAAKRQPPRLGRRRRRNPVVPDVGTHSLGLQIRIGNLVDFDMAAGLRENLAEVMACPTKSCVAVRQRLCNTTGPTKEALASASSVWPRNRTVPSTTNSMNWNRGCSCSRWP